MAKTRKIKKTSTAAASRPVPTVTMRYCAARFPKPPKASRGMKPARLRLIRETAFKWMNGTTIKYWFYTAPAKRVGPEAQKEVVRASFAKWKALGIGLDFEEVSKQADADLRIAFDQDPDEGSWSYIGTDCRNQSGPTINFGWDLLTDPDTALHEIGHALGFPHEHQNPFAGIVWDEEAVYMSLAKPPNNWKRSTTFHNIIEKIVPDTVKGGNWDPDSIMHYPFDKGLIKEPEKYRRGLTPKGGLSSEDRAWVQHFYPGQPAASIAALQPFQSVPLAITPGGQADFDFAAPETREYTFSTFGTADTQLAISRVKDGTLETIAEDDDSGVDRNARIALKLKKGDTVRVQVRMRFIENAGSAALMAW